MNREELYEEYSNQYPLIMGFREVTYEDWLQKQVIDLRTNKPLPPAEGAEGKKTCVLCTKPAMDNGLCFEHNVCNVPKQPQPIAEGAEEIEAELRGYARDIVRLHKPIMEVNPQLAMDSIGNDLVKMFNRLAQRLADKMVSERTKEESDNTNQYSDTLLSFIDEIQYMQKLYAAKRFTQAEKKRDELAEGLDDIMRDAR